MGPRPGLIDTTLENSRLIVNVVVIEPNGSKVPSLYSSSDSLSPSYFVFSECISLPLLKFVIARKGLKEPNDIGRGNRVTLSLT